jgi:hypothetical protein
VPELSFKSKMGTKESGSELDDQLLGGSANSCSKTLFWQAVDLGNVEDSVQRVMWRWGSAHAGAPAQSLLRLLCWELDQEWSKSSSANSPLLTGEQQGDFVTATGLDRFAWVVAPTKRQKVIGD